jgi:uncharacterized protein
LLFAFAGHWLGEFNLQRQMVSGEMIIDMPPFEMELKFAKVGRCAPGPADELYPMLRQVKSGYNQPMAESSGTAQLTQVLPINQRRRIPAQAIDETVRQIVEKFQPQQVILFGSYARGKPRPESDVDLLVVMDTPLKGSEQAVRICQAIEYHYGLDLLVYTPATLAERLALGDPFLREIMQQGKMMYEHPHR